MWKGPWCRGYSLSSKYHRGKCGLLWRDEENSVTFEVAPYSHHSVSKSEGNINTQCWAERKNCHTWVKTSKSRQPLQIVNFSFRLREFYWQQFGWELSEKVTVTPYHMSCSWMNCAKVIDISVVNTHNCDLHHEHMQTHINPLLQISIWFTWGGWITVTLKGVIE